MNDFLVYNQKSRKKVRIVDIAYLIGHINYTMIHLKSGKSILSAHHLKYYENLLPIEIFTRLRQNIIVGEACIIGENWKIYFQEKEIGIVSRRNYNKITQ